MGFVSLHLKSPLPPLALTLA